MIRKIFALLTLAALVAADSFTPEEEEALKKFRPMVEHLLYKQYFQRDDYLIKWLRTRDLDVDAAKEALEKNMQWRKTENIDSYLEEDQSKADKCIKSVISGHDRRGRPVIYAPAGQWDIRKCALGGLMPQMVRYVITHMYEALQNVTEKSVDPTGAANVTQGYFVVDLHGFNARTGACFACLPIYAALLDPMEKYYPGFVHKLMLINAPRAFDPVVQILLPLASKETKEVLHVKGHDKDEWAPILSNDIAADQLPKVYGGDKVLGN